MRPILIIPAFDEEPAIAGIVEAALRYIPAVMVIDDGSEDATTLASALAGAMVHRFKDNLGKGEALKFGFWYALDSGYDWVLTMDGDGEHDPRDIPKFMPMLAGFDLVLGNRMEDSAGMPRGKRWANRMCSLVVSVLTARRIYDSQSGFRAYSANLLREVRLSSRRSDLETEVLIKAARKRLRIGQIPIQTLPGAKPAGVRVRDAFRFVRVVLKSFLWW